MNFISICPPDYIILHALVNVAVNMGIAMGWAPHLPTLSTMVNKCTCPGKQKH